MGVAMTTTKKDEAYQFIRQAIISGALKPGEILNIGELSERFGVGKTPTREALVVLAFEGWIEPIPRSGYLIASITVRDVLETFHLRAVLEVEAIGLAVDRITEADIRALEENNQAELEAAQGVSTYKRGYELNREFHLIIARASDNSRLVRLVEQFIDEMERILALDPYITGPRQHAEILDALKRRDRRDAQQAMRKHLEETKSRILDRF